MPIIDIHVKLSDKNTVYKQEDQFRTLNINFNLNKQQAYNENQEYRKLQTE